MGGVELVYELIFRGGYNVVNVLFFSFLFVSSLVFSCQFHSFCLVFTSPLPHLYLIVLLPVISNVLIFSFIED